MFFQSINPYNGNIFSEHKVLTDKELDEKLKISAKAFKNWRNIGYFILN